MQASGAKCRTTRPQAASVRQSNAAVVTLSRRSAAAAALAVALGALRQPPAVAADAAAAPKLPEPAGGIAISITKADSSVKEYMKRRDEAMENQCPGGMFDCLGDRRDYAKQQWKDFLDSGGVPKRIREGRPDGPRAL